MDLKTTRADTLALRFHSNKTSEGLIQLLSEGDEKIINLFEELFPFFVIYGNLILVNGEFQYFFSIVR